MFKIHYWFPVVKPVALLWHFKIVFLVLVGGYVGLLVLLYLKQESLIFPGRDMQGSSECFVDSALDFERLQLKTAEGETVQAVFARAADSKGRELDDFRHRPTLIYFYGNGMCLSDALGELRDYRRLGVNVVSVDYVGYGSSSGSPSERGCYAAADALYDHLSARKDVDPKKIVALGRSLGSGVAVDLAIRKPLAGLVLFSAYTSMGDMARELYPFVPASLLLKHRFESKSKIAEVSCPILIAHGRRDTIISPTMSMSLAKLAKSPVTEFYPENYGHNDFWGTDLLKSLGDFLGRLNS